MGDKKATVVNARRELEELYLGIPDESVNLTFEDLVKLKQQSGIAERKQPTIEPIQEVHVTSGNEGLGIAKSPSFAFIKGLQVSNGYGDHRIEGDIKYSSPRDHHRYAGTDHRYYQGNPFHNHTVQDTTSITKNNDMRSLESSFMYDDGSVCARSTFAERGGRKRAGIPHSNICTICSTYIYVFRNRCLVCGRVYCRQCKNIGMGDMTEGRKCVECLGRRFSQRYIQKAGEIGCCAGYSSTVKQQELIWAEKGPRRNGDHHRREHGGGGGHDLNSNSMMTSATKPRVSRSPSPVRAAAYVASNPPPFVMGSPFSASYTPTHHHIPF
ncbi:hypothetical protein C5167_045355 [Papaver somniferum]|uniref:Uncharacterized protein n=1 Tax=Papaver somniferum TaxID=3469 RepID=A0A4Y7LBF0_PAPSO|nr:uncharacterized protein LOC113323143 [Papaver somniferum]RZC82566.1 hypothetical protein C5167_045355 [Papaver somniferum]